MIILFLVLFVSTAQAAEVCTDRTEFISVMQTCQIDKKQNALYREKDMTQGKIIKEQDKLIAQRDELIAKLSEANEKADVLIEDLKIDREERQQLEASLRGQLATKQSNWMERIEWAGYGAALPVAVQVVRKLVLKF